MSQNAKDLLAQQIEKLKKAKEAAQVAGQSLKEQAKKEEQSQEETQAAQPD